MSAPRDRDSLLAARLRELAGIWVQVRCGSCQWVVVMPMQLAARAHGRLTLRDWLARLKCTQCGERPSSAVVADKPIVNASVAGGATWSVFVVP